MLTFVMPEWRFGYSCNRNEDCYLRAHYAQKNSEIKSAKLTRRLFIPLTLTGNVLTLGTRNVSSKRLVAESPPLARHLCLYETVVESSR